MKARRWLGKLTGLWLALTLIYLGLPVEWQNSRMSDLAIGLGVLIVVTLEVMLISRQQR